jgi:hypothetical protein
MAPTLQRYNFIVAKRRKRVPQANAGDCDEGCKPSGGVVLSLPKEVLIARLKCKSAALLHKIADNNLIYEYIRVNAELRRSLS